MNPIPAVSIAFRNLIPIDINTLSVSGASRAQHYTDVRFF